MLKEARLKRAIDKRITEENMISAAIELSLKIDEKEIKPPLLPPPLLPPPLLPPKEEIKQEVKEEIKDMRKILAMAAEERMKKNNCRGKTKAISAGGVPICAGLNDFRAWD